MTYALQPQATIGAPRLNRSQAGRSQAWDQDLTELIQRIGQGDQSAFTAFYKATHALVYGLALRIVRDGAAAEDVTIEVYLQLHQQAARYHPARGTPAAWILTLTRSRAIDSLRRETVHRQCESLPDPMSFPSPRPDPEAQSVVAERCVMVRKALATLTKEQRQVVESAYYTGLSHSQIAAQLGQPLGTVKTRIRIGLTTLRAQLAPLLDDAWETPLETA
jgi:RNA polymerase sigma-70 factor (ECF subfamily)